MSLHVYGALALAFAVWAVSLGGLAGIQEKCGAEEVATMSQVNFAAFDCGKAFRLQWFTVALEFTAIVIAALFLATNNFITGRATVIGIFSIATVLYIYMTDLTLGLKEFAPFTDGSRKDKLLTWFAGSIMTATVNFIVIIAAGIGGFEVEKKEIVEVAVKEAV